MSDQNAYQHFATFYDVLMSDAPYDLWVEFLKRKTLQYGITGGRLLDVGCGTGTLALMLSATGYQVTGVDLSEEMLAVALDKALQEDVNVHFIQQDMRHLDLGETFEVVTAFCDVMNYLENESDVMSSLQSVYHHLAPGGLFLFDVHSVYKMDCLFRNHSFSYAGEDLAYIWDVFEGAFPHSVEHEISFFVEESPGLYRRFDECHRQRTFPVEFYKSRLEQTGFTVLSVEGDFKEGRPAEDAERLFFTAVKAT
ncbi:class I SAM-dependent DNA methyltransferase [Tuberibacillus calidus]|jgi:SAM-dependent methyltransferase|uniref:class I SAM-dependent DNA methyltransferase n=1 Tax=Tuberibacillus calidus TaxID=340097 RepID=UPI00040A557F|nr:class I SAM-dependent methyltransferase [Tuberibacillus calidus]